MTAPSVPDLLRLPTVRAAFCSTLLARLGYGAVPLALLLGIRDRTGSFATAGLALAGFGLATVAMPVKARLVDRRGQRAVLPVLGALYGAALLLVVVVPVSLLVVVAALAGAVAPPVGPSMRARWSSVTRGTARERAFALDTVSEEALYVASPAMTGALATVSPTLAVVVAAVAVLAGGVGLGLSPGAPVRTDTAGRAGRRLPPGLSAALVVAAGFGAGTALVEFAVTARAVDDGHSAWTGVLVGAFALGSVVGGASWGRRLHTRSPAVHLAGLTLWLAVGTAAVATAGPTVAVGIVLFVVGLAVSPVLIVVYLDVDARTVTARRTEANTWLGTSTNLGSAAGAAIGGALVTGVGPRWSVLVAAVPLLVAAAASTRLPRRDVGGPR